MIAEKLRISGAVAVLAIYGFTSNTIFVHITFLARPCDGGGTRA